MLAPRQRGGPPTTQEVQARFCPPTSPAQLPLSQGPHCPPDRAAIRGCCALPRASQLHVTSPGRPPCDRQHPKTGVHWAQAPVAHAPLPRLRATGVVCVGLLLVLGTARVGAARPRGAVSPGGEGSGQAQRGPSAAAGLPWGRQGQGSAELLGGWRVPPNAERGPPPLYSGEAGAQGRARGRGSHGESAMGASGLLLSCPTQVTKCKGHGGQHASRTSLRPPNGSTRTHSRFLSGGDPKEQRGPSPHADGRPRRRTTGRPLTAGADGDRGSARPVGTEASSLPGPRCSVVRERASSRRSRPAPPPTESEPPGGPRGSPGCTPESENRRWRAVS